MAVTTPLTRFREQEPLDQVQYSDEEGGQEGEEVEQSDEEDV